MIELGVSYFSELLALATDPAVDFQYVKVASWLDAAAFLQSWHRRTACPWLSAHPDYDSDKQVRAFMDEGKLPPRRSAGQGFARICSAVQTTRAELAVLLLLEKSPTLLSREGM